MPRICGETEEAAMNKFDVPLDVTC